MTHNTSKQVWGRCIELSQVIFFVTKNKKKAARLCMKLSSTTNANVLKCLNPLDKNQYAPFLLLPVFQIFSQRPGSTKW